MKRRWFLVIPILIVLLVAWRIVQQTRESAAESQMREGRKSMPASVQVAQAQIRDISDTFEAVGSIQSTLDVKIAPKLTGRISSLTVHEGDTVKKGQVLVRIDPSQVQAEVREADAAAAEAQYRLAQAKLTQNPTNVSVNAQVRQQQAAVNSARASFNQVKENYNAQVAAADASVQSAEGRVNSAQANLENARVKLNRRNELHGKGFISAQDVDDARTAVSVAEASLASAKAEVEAARNQASITRRKGTADIEAARASMEQALASAEYASANTAQKDAYAQSIEALKANLDAARANAAAARSRLSDTVLTSPLDGFVTGRYADPGSLATTGKDILEVQSTGRVWVTVPVPEEVNVKLKVGHTADVRLDSCPGRVFTGRITQMNPSANTESRQFQVRVVMENEECLFKPGMFAKVSFITGRVRGAVVVPREAVRNDDSGDFVYAVDDKNIARRRTVTLGASDSSYMQISFGVEPGEKVVVMAGRLDDGQPVITGGQRPGGPPRHRKQ